MTKVTVEQLNDLIEYIKRNVYLSGAKWRSDIGARVEPFESEFLSRRRVAQGKLYQVCLAAERLPLRRGALLARLEHFC